MSEHDTTTERRDSQHIASLIDAVTGNGSHASTRNGHPLVGVLPGEGIGPELAEHARRVLDAVTALTGVRAHVEYGGPIGLDARRAGGSDLSDEVAAFCDDIFTRGGAVLAGPGGGRFVYDLRKRFDLYCKFSPLSPRAELADASRLRSDRRGEVDIIIVRDNIAGVYQGRSTVTESSNGSRDGRVVRHEFSYSEAQVRRLALAGARLASTRRGHVTLVVKRGGVPQVSGLWADVTERVCEAVGVGLTVVDADHCAYQLIQRPETFDVVITPNLLGDILADLGAVLLGSRGVSYSGNFGPGGEAVYQTNHGSAHDLVGTDRANPAGHLLAMAMMLRESFGLAREAATIEGAIRAAWRDGWRTDDVSTPAHRGIGTRDFVARVIDRIRDDNPDAERSAAS